MKWLFDGFHKTKIIKKPQWVSVPWTKKTHYVSWFDDGIDSTNICLCGISVNFDNFSQAESKRLDTTRCKRCLKILSIPDVPEMEEKDD